MCCCTGSGGACSCRSGGPPSGTRRPSPGGNRRRGLPGRWRAHRFCPLEPAETDRAAGGMNKAPRPAAPACRADPPRGVSPQVGLRVDARINPGVDRPVLAPHTGADHTKVRPQRPGPVRDRRIGALSETARSLRLAAQNGQFGAVLLGSPWSIRLPQRRPCPGGSAARVPSEETGQALVVWHDRGGMQGTVLRASRSVGMCCSRNRTCGPGSRAHGIPARRRKDADRGTGW